jgi:hypothetical protein
MRRVMQVGDVIKVTRMPVYNFPDFKPPMWALVIEKRPSDEDPDYHGLVIIEGGYGHGKDPGEEFNLHGMPRGRREVDWRIVPPQCVPGRIWVEIAKWQLLR